MKKVMFFVVMMIALNVMGFDKVATTEPLTKKQIEAITVHLNSAQYALWQSYLAVRLQKGKETLIVYAAPYLLTDGKRLSNSAIERFEIVVSGFIKHGWRPTPSMYGSDSDYQVHTYVKYNSATGVEVVNHKKNRRKAVIHGPGYVEDVVKAVVDISQLPPLEKMLY